MEEFCPSKTLGRFLGPHNYVLLKVKPLRARRCRIRLHFWDRRERLIRTSLRSRGLPRLRDSFDLGTFRMKVREKVSMKISEAGDRTERGSKD